MYRIVKYKDKTEQKILFAFELEEQHRAEIVNWVTVVEKTLRN